MGRTFDIPAPRPLDEQNGSTFAALVQVMRRLLAPDGCPWDREQTYRSLRQYVLEEACEVIDAIEEGDRDALAEELGDLALQIVFLAELGRRDGAFGPDDVVRGICEKLVRRHPHVFGEEEADDAEDVRRIWADAKTREKGRRALLDGIPRSLPALTRATRMSERVSRVGFDWPTARGSRDKVAEELAELDEAVDRGEPQRVRDELGDLLFALVNLARHHGIDAEDALRGTTDRFQRRFSHVEERVRDERGDWPRDRDGKPTTGVGLEELDAHWNSAKKEGL